MIKFIKYRYIYLIISSLVLIPGIFSLMRWGIKPSVDFTGGSLVEFQFTQIVPKEIIEKVLMEQSIEYSSIQSAGDTNFIIRSKELTDDHIASVQAELATVSAQTPVIIREEMVGPIMGAELLQKTLFAAILAIIGILIYVAFVFKNFTYGVSAIVALLHDTLILFGIFSLFGHFKGIEVDTLFVTAVLTTMSFSVHDTIVVFDRIRESVKANPKAGFESILDQSLSETMVRSLNNSFTIIFMLLSLFLLGGSSIKWFVLALLIGTIVGTYSSPFVATPVLYELHKWQERRKKN